MKATVVLNEGNIKKFTYPSVSVSEFGTVSFYESGYLAAVVAANTWVETLIVNEPRQEKKEKGEEFEQWLSYYCSSINLAVPLSVISDAKVIMKAAWDAARQG